MNAIIETNETLTLNNLFYKVWDYLYNNWLTVNIKWKIYPNKTWFRQLAMYLWISIEITKESRINTDKYFLYEFSVKAISKDWRYTECSASCSSDEREFNNLENDVRTIAQTRATNRAISDLLGMSDITHYIKSWCAHNSSPSSQHSQKAYVKEKKYEDSEDNEEVKVSNTITPKQKELLTKLILEIFEDTEEQKAYIESINELNKQEANFHIKQLLEEKGARG